jgi:hypothetical protein
MEAIPMHAPVTPKPDIVVSPLHVLTMADLLARIEQDAQLSCTRRRDLISAVRSFCRLLRLDPAATPAVHTYFRRHIQNFRHLSAGTSRKTFQNVRALVSAALRRYVAVDARTGCKFLTPEWKALWDRIRDKPDLMYGMSRLMRFCSEHGIAHDGTTFSANASMAASRVAAYP